MNDEYNLEAVFIHSSLIFSGIHYLGLVCDDEVLTARLRAPFVTQHDRRVGRRAR